MVARVRARRPGADCFAAARVRQLLPGRSITALRAFSGADRSLPRRPRLRRSHRPVDLNTYYFGTPAAASGKVRTPDRPGRRSSTGPAWPPSARSPSPRQPADHLRRHREETAATVCTSRPTAAGRGSTSACATRTTSIHRRQPPPILTRWSSRESAIALRARIAAFPHHRWRRTWTKVLYVDDTAGCPAVVAAPDAPRVMFATLYIRAPASGVLRSRRDQAGRTSCSAGRTAIHSGSPLSSLTDAAPRGRSSRERTRFTAVGRQALGVVARSNGRIVSRACATGSIDPRRRPELDAREHDPRITPVGVITDRAIPDLVYVTQTRSIAPSTRAHVRRFAGAPSATIFSLSWRSTPAAPTVSRPASTRARSSASTRENMEQLVQTSRRPVLPRDHGHPVPYHVYAARRQRSVAVPNRSDFGETAIAIGTRRAGSKFGYLAPDRSIRHRVCGRLVSHRGPLRSPQRPDRARLRCRD